MANQTAFNPVYVDTAPYVWQPNAAGLPTLIPLKITKIVWTKQVSTGDHATLKDAYGNLIWDAEAYQANFEQETQPGWVNGLQVTRLDSGALQIYLAMKC